MVKYFVERPEGAGSKHSEIASGFKQELSQVSPRDRVRSHMDIYHGDREMFSLFQGGGRWGTLANSLREKFYWECRLEELKYDSKDTWFDVRNLKFRPDYIEPRSGLNPENLDLFIYPRIDIGFGGIGYGVENGGKGLHIDMSHRICSAMLYLTDQSKLSGGEIEVWNSPREMQEKIDLRELLGVSILQDHNGWHRVNPITSCAEPRIAVYMALSCTKDIWRTR